MKLKINNFLDYSPFSKKIKYDDRKKKLVFYIKYTIKLNLYSKKYF